MKTYAVIITGISLLFMGAMAEASMRCQKGIIDEGDTTADVLKKCGQPSDRQVIDPIVGSNGQGPLQVVADGKVGLRAKRRHALLLAVSRRQASVLSLK